MTRSDRAASRFEFLDAAPAGATVTIDASIRSTEQLLATLAAALDFDPGVPTWGALVDRLSDASFQAGTEVSIDHPSLPAVPDADLRLYLGHLSDAFARGSIECAGLRVTFRTLDMVRVPAQDFEGAPPASEEAIAVVERHLGRALPAPYRGFLLRANGGVGFAADRYMILWRVEDLLENNTAYEVEIDAAGFFLFGSDGGGEAYAFDLTKSDFRVYLLPFIGMERDVALPILFPFAELAPTAEIVRVPHVDDNQTPR